ncbi:radical SAM protein [Pelagibacterales bacterium SAG-MED33]|nr:radical SAM protein [Pelagibacterales bacterium SAG-MED33]
MSQVETTNLKSVNSNNLDLIDFKLNSLKNKVEKILLVQPIQVDETEIDVGIALNKRYYMYPPYGLGILNKVFKNNNYKSDVLDLNFEVFEYIHTQKKVSSNDLTNRWKKKLKEKLKLYKPDLVGVSCTFTMNHKNMMDIFQVVKNFDNEIITVAGGVHVSNATEIVLKEGKNIDFANTYEGERSFVDFLKYINGEKDIKLGQISFMYDNEFYQILNRKLPEGDDLNIIPDFGKLKLDNLTNLGEIGTFRYWRPKNSKGSAVLAKKGCRARCSFCSVRNFNGKGVRAKSVKTVVDEIQGLKENFGIDHITWLDDDLLADPNETMDLFNEIVKRKLNITWDASNGLIASAAVTRPELISAAEESGCIGAYFGIESGNDQILKNIHKPSGVKHYRKLGPLMNKHPRIFTRGFLMIGFPDETLSQVLDTINVSVEMGLDWYTVQLLTPLPSTEIYDQMVEAGKAKKNELNLKGEGFTMFSVRESERQRKIEQESKRENKDFVNLLNENKEHVPSQKELNDLWFLTDYEINYKPIFRQNDKNKLHKLECFLTDVSDRMTRDNPLSNYFLGVVKEKLGKKDEANQRKKTVKDYLTKSDYWIQRFKTLNLN